MRLAPKRRRRWALALVGSALWAVAGGSALALGPASPPPPTAESAHGAASAEDVPPAPGGPGRDDLRSLRQQVEEQGRLLDELRARVARKAAADAAPPPAGGDLPPPTPPDMAAVEKLVTDYLKRKDEEKQRKEEEDKARKEAEGYKVGSDLKMGIRWNPLNGVTFETPNKDFVSHLGFWFQYDSVWFTQSPRLLPLSQLGNLQDGTFFRRVRPEWEGTAWEVLEWDVILALEQVTNGVPNLNEVWVGLAHLPVVGTVRVGKNRIPQGLEAGTYTGNRPATFMEVSPSGTAFYEMLGVGLWANNSVLDQRVTWEAMAYRQDNDPGGLSSGQNGVSFGDGKYAYAARLTGLPIFEHDGRCLLHLGASYGWRKAEDIPPPAGVQAGTVGPTAIDFRARPQLRDAIGAYGTGGLPGNASQLVDTGLVNAASSSVMGTELLYIAGPLSVQAEWTWASANDATVPNPHPGRAGPRTLRLGDVWFDGGYVQLSYFLTGENRRYDRRLGRLSRNTIGSPYTPFWVTRGEDGGWLFGHGAWEIATRYSHLNLDNGPIQGGQTDAYEVGVNWYLSANFRIQCEYLHQLRYRKGTGPFGTLPGDVDGLGIRAQLMF